MDSPLAQERSVELFGIGVAALTLDETVTCCDRLIADGNVHHHVSLNAAKAVKIASDARLRSIAREAAIVSADGMSIVWGSRLLGLPVPERVAGIDLMEALLARAAVAGHGVYFLGATKPIVAAVAREEQGRHRGLRVVGWRDGYWDAGQEADVVAEIAATRPDILFVALPTPRKEEFAARHLHALGVPLVVGVGGSFDVVAGQISRAPLWMRRSGLEWLHRLLQEPRRMAGRYLVGNTAFVLLLAKEILRGREWSRAPLP